MLFVRRMEARFEDGLPVCQLDKASFDIAVRSPEKGEKLWHGVRAEFLHRSYSPVINVNPSVSN